MLIRPPIEAPCKSHFIDLHNYVASVIQIQGPHKQVNQLLSNLLIYMLILAYHHPCKPILGTCIVPPKFPIKAHLSFVNLCCTKEYSLISDHLCSCSMIPFCLRSCYAIYIYAFKNYKQQQCCMYCSSVQNPNTLDVFLFSKQVYYILSSWVSPHHEMDELLFICYISNTTSCSWALEGCLSLS